MINFRIAGLFLSTLGLIFFTLSSEVVPDRPYSYTIKSDLHNYLMACKDYWKKEGLTKNCSVEIASNHEYGFYKSRGVQIISKGTGPSFSAFGHHKKGRDVYKIDHKGNVKEVKTHPFPPPPPPKNRWGRFIECITGGTT